MNACMQTTFQTMKIPHIMMDLVFVSQRPTFMMFQNWHLFTFNTALSFCSFSNFLSLNDGFSSVECFSGIGAAEAETGLPFEELENLKHFDKLHILKNTFDDFFFKTGF